MPSFHKESYAIFYENLKKIHCLLEFNQSKKNRSKDGKVWYKLMENAIYRKAMGNLRHRIDVKLVNNEKDYLKYISKPSYMSRKIFDSNLGTIRKSKLTLKINKAAYIGMCILKLSKVSIHEFYYDYIKNKYDNRSKLLFTETDSLMYEMFDFRNYSTKSKYCDDSNKLIIGKMEDKTQSAAIEEFVGLNPKTYSFLVDNNKYKKVKGVNIIVATISDH